MKEEVEKKKDRYKKSNYVYEHLITLIRMLAASATKQLPLFSSTVIPLGALNEQNWGSPSSLDCSPDPAKTAGLLSLPMVYNMNI